MFAHARWVVCTLGTHGHVCMLLMKALSLGKGGTPRGQTQAHAVLMCPQLSGEQTLCSGLCRTVHGWFHLGVFVVAPLHEWACVQVTALPTLPSAAAGTLEQPGSYSQLHACPQL